MYLNTRDDSPAATGHLHDGEWSASCDTCLDEWTEERIAALQNVDPEPTGRYRRAQEQAQRELSEMLHGEYEHDGYDRDYAEEQYWTNYREE